MNVHASRSLTPEQQAEADRIEAELRRRCDAKIREMAQLLASKSNRELFGQTEHQLRDLCHGVGADALDAALAERKKPATAAPAGSVRTARRRRGSSTAGDANS